MVEASLEEGIKVELTAIEVAAQTIAGAISGTEMQVDVITSALPTDAATINDSYPTGTGSNNTITMINANEAYSVPTIASTKNHVLILYNGSDTDMYWGYSTLITGGILLASGATMSINLGANQTIFMYCGIAGKIINITYKEIN
jgi:hypothetical protein